MKSTDETHLTGHKFRSANRHFWENLESSSVYFAQPDQLNDPYDCQIDLMKAARLALGGQPMAEEALERWSRFTKAVTEPAKNCGVLSLCTGDIRGMNERLLWAHYADNHRGVCITYEVPYTFVDSIVGLAPVTYGSDRLMQALRSVDLTKRLDFETHIQPVVTAFLTTKAEQWAYEREARFISEKPGLVTFEREWLSQICFGLNTPGDERRAVIDAVKRIGYPNCKFTELVHSEDGLYALESRLVEMQ